jgi:hypothetical protein
MLAQIYTIWHILYNIDAKIIYAEIVGAFELGRYLNRYFPNLYCPVLAIMN